MARDNTLEPYTETLISLHTTVIDTLVRAILLLLKLRLWPRILTDPSTKPKCKQTVGKLETEMNNISFMLSGLVQLTPRTIKPTLVSQLFTTIISLISITLTTFAVRHVFISDRHPTALLYMFLIFMIIE